MTVRRLVRPLAGVTALLSLGCLYYFYAPALAGSLRLPLPTLQLSASGLSSASGQLTQYKESPTLTITKLGLKAPILRNISVGDQGAYDAALHDGIAQAKGSADLEAKDGNTFIFGHSSNVSLHPSTYDAIFAGLPSLTPSDSMQISVGGRVQTYTVTTSQAVDASAVQYLNASGDRKLTLVTCWPLGTDYKRWVVEATRVN
ncbi:MAG: sortase [bacterium]